MSENRRTQKQKNPTFRGYTEEEDPAKTGKSKKTVGGKTVTWFLAEKKSLCFKDKVVNCTESLGGQEG